MLALAFTVAVAAATGQGCGRDSPARGSNAAAGLDRVDAARATRRTPVTPAPLPVTTASSSTTVAPEALTAPPPAPPAPTTVATTAAPVTGAVPTPEQLGAEAVRLVRYDLGRLPGWEIAFLPGRPGFLGLTFPERRRIEVYVRANETARSISYNLAHEIGHAVDLTASTRASRHAYRNIRGIPAATPWFGCRDCPDFATPAGDFAEAFALIVTDPAFDWRSRMGPRPTPTARAAIVAVYHL